MHSRDRRRLADPRCPNGEKQPPSSRRSGGPEIQIDPRETVETARAQVDPSLDEIRFHRAEDYILLKHATADDSFSDAGDGDSFLVPGRVYKECPAIDSSCKNSLGSAGASLNARNHAEIVQQWSHRGGMRFRRQIDRVSFPEFVDCDRWRVICGIHESRDDSCRRWLENFIAMNSGLNRVIA